MKAAARWALAVFFVLAGLNHFRAPELYLAMMPPWLPAPGLLNVVSGGAEVLGGLGVLLPRVRRAAGFGLIALLVAVFPANVHVALQGHMEGVDGPPWALWARLPFQVLFIAWVWWVAVKRERPA